MRIAVTGRGGQLASAMLEQAARTPEIALLAFVRSAVDLTRPEGILPALRSVQPDVVVNAAAYTAVDQAESEPDVAMAVNGIGAGAVAEAAAILGIPVVQISTDYVFDGLKASPYVESDATSPLNAYGRSKLAGEHAVARATTNHAILRTAWVYAAEGRNFVKTMLRLGAERDELRVVADQRGAPGYAPDLAEAVLSVCRNLVTRPTDTTLRGTFHMAGAGETTWAGFAEAIFDGAGQRGGPACRVTQITTADYPTPAKRPANALLDCRKLAERHGVLLPPWQDGLARCLERLYP
jgi:dTDP-4-dehydrorhamnose reductase